MPPGGPIGATPNARVLSVDESGWPAARLLPRGAAAAVLVFADAQLDEHSDDYGADGDGRDCEHERGEHIDPSDFGREEIELHVEADRRHARQPAEHDARDGK